MEKPLENQEALDSSHPLSPTPEPATTSLQRLRVRLRPLAFVVICGSLTLDSFNVTGLTYEQLDIAERFDVIPTTASWTLSAYALAFGSFLLLAGRAGDMYGHKMVYSIGLIFFSLFALLGAAVDQNFVALCIFRALQGASAACTVPTAYAMVGVRYTGQAREMAVAGLGVSSTTGAIMGSIVGGAFASTSLGYRGVLWLSFGISSVLCVLAFAILEPTPREAYAEKRPLDLIGSFLVVSGCAVLVYGFTEAPTGWGHVKVIAPIIIGALLLVSFIMFEQFIIWKYLPRVDPLIPTRVWTYSNLIPLTVQTGFFYGCFFLSVLNGSQFLLRVQERKPLISAVMWSPLIVGMLIFCIVMGPFYNHRYMPPKVLLVLGSFILAAGVTIFTRNDVDTGYWQYSFPGTLVMAVGTAIFFVHYLNVAYAATPSEDQGLVSGIIQTSAQVATALGQAIGSSFISSDTPKDLLPEYRHSFYVAIAFGCAGSIVALLFIKPIPPRPSKSKAKDLEVQQSSVTSQNSQPGSTTNVDHEV